MKIEKRREREEEIEEAETEGGTEGEDASCLTVCDAPHTSPRK